MVSVTNSLPGSPAVIEAANWRDINSLRQLERVCFPKDRWPLWELVGVLSLPNVVRLKAVMDGGMVGFRMRKAASFVGRQFVGMTHHLGVV